MAILKTSSLTEVFVNGNPIGCVAGWDVGTKEDISVVYNPLKPTECFKVPEKKKPKTRYDILIGR